MPRQIFYMDGTVASLVVFWSLIDDISVSAVLGATDPLIRQLDALMEVNLPRQRLHERTAAGFAQLGPPDDSNYGCR